MAAEETKLSTALGWPTRIAATLVVALVIAFYFWTAASAGNRASFGEKKSTDYYNLLVQGFLDGHLHMKVTPDPKLRVELPNRVTTPDAHWLLDASYYQGKYYLYFGATPALTLFLPWRVLTGHDYPEWAAVPLLAAAAYLVALVWLALMRREFFPRAGGVTWVCLVAALGLANGVSVVLRRPLFYEVAVTAGWLWAAAGVLCLTMVVLRRVHALRWLVAASVCAGLAAGSRPTLVVGGGLAVGLTAAWCWWRARDENRIPLVRLLAAAGLPLGCAVGALLWYNWARFENPLEFGLLHQLGSNGNGFPFTFESIARNLRVYYFTPPDVGWFFPFVAPGPKPVDYYFEQVHGQFWFLPLLALGAVTLAWAARARALRADLVVVIGAAFAWAGASLVVVAMAPVQSNRYALDFHPLLFSTVLLVLLAVAHVRQRALAAVIGIWLVGLMGLNVGASLHVHHFFREGNPQGYERLARWCDRAVWPLFGLTRPALGSVELSVTFPKGEPGRVEPLLVAGAGTDVDSVMVRYEASGQATLIFDHQGIGGRESALFSLRPGEPHKLVLHLGTLSPPEWHPWYESLPPGASRLATHVRIVIDDVEVLALDTECHRASPNQITLGQRRGFLAGEPEFGGTIKMVRGLGPDLAWLGKALAETGPVRLRVRLPQDRFGALEPLLLTGGVQRYDLVCVRYDDARTISVGVQHAGWPVVKFSAPIAIDYGQPHEFEIELGSLAPGAWVPADRLDAWRDRGASVRLDGRTVLTERFTTHPAERWQQFAGSTPQQFTVSRRLYGGPMEILPRRGVAAPALAAALGAGRPIEFRLRFPTGRAGVCEPLLTTGVVGAGDGLYVRYVDAGRVVFGLDHWGRGGPESEPVAIDYDLEHQLVVAFGALLPAGDPGRARLRVELDGATVMDVAQVYHPAAPAETRVGVNHLGFSTSQEVFTGGITAISPR